jgi:hypothetical protein
MKSLIVGIIIVVTIIVIGVGLGNYAQSIVEKQTDRVKIKEKF